MAELVVKDVRGCVARQKVSPLVSFRLQVDAADCSYLSFYIYGHVIA
jgi:hypothetical protein